MADRIQLEKLAEDFLNEALKGYRAYGEIEENLSLSTLGRRIDIMRVVAPRPDSKIEVIAKNIDDIIKCDPSGVVQLDNVLIEKGKVMTDHGLAPPELMGYIVGLEVSLECELKEDIGQRLERGIKLARIIRVKSSQHPIKDLVTLAVGLSMVAYAANNVYNFVDVNCFDSPVFSYASDMASVFKEKTAGLQDEKICEFRHWNRIIKAVDYGLIPVALAYRTLILKLNGLWGKDGEPSNELRTEGLYATHRNPSLTPFLMVGAAWTLPALHFAYATTPTQYGPLVIATAGMALMYTALTRRAMNEEKALEIEFGEKYVEYKAKTPRFVPGLGHILNWVEKKLYSSKG